MANLPQVSTTSVVQVVKFAAGVVDTHNKFAIGVVDTGGNFAASVVDSVANSPRIFVKIRNNPNVIFRGLGKDDS